MTTDKVEEIVKTFGNELAMHLTPSTEAMKAVRFAREALADTLTQHHQDLMAEIIKDVNKMWVDELSRKDREEGATAVGYSKVVAYLSRKV